MSNYAKIKTFDIANGKGIRTSIFFSGCEFYCKECFNSELWNFNYGYPFTKDVYEKKIYPTITNHIAGLSILGGEPLHSYNLEAVSQLCTWFKTDFPHKNIWLWTGYTIEVLIEKAKTNEYMNNILNKVNTIVDGKFDVSQKDLSLPFRGSKNQRVISNIHD